MLISIVIATYNRRALLARTLPTVLAQAYPAADFEVVLVVDGSTDGTAEWARSLDAPCALQVIEQPNRGPAAARNAGIAAAGGDDVLFLDDDIRCEPELVREHAAGHRADPDALIHGALFLAPESPRTLAAEVTGDWYRQHNATVAANGLRPGRNVYLNANSSVARTVLDELGGFDEAVPFPREDFELGLRIWKCGTPLVYRPQAIAYEVFEKPSKSFARSDAAGQARADVVICRKHPDYRPHSPLAPRDPPAPARLAAGRLFRRLPRGTETLLDPAVALAERFIDLPGARRVGLHLIAAQRGIASERAASEEAGSPGDFEDAFDRQLAVLLYHRIGLPLHGFDPRLTVSPANFDRQIGWLSRRGYSSVPASDWQAWREGRGELPARPVLITFDDGYADIAEYATPILRHHGFGALVFAVSGMLGESMTWAADGTQLDGPPLLSGDELKSLAQEGIELGAHGRTHRDLTGVSRDELADEVGGSRSDLERLTGTAVQCFAYPFGRRNPSVEEVVAVSYDLAFTTDRGVNGLATPPHELRRCDVGPTDSPIDVEWRARRGHVPLARSRDALRLRARAGTLRDGLATRPGSPRGPA